MGSGDPGPCDGCGVEDPFVTEQLWLAAPLGLCSVKVHKVRECAELAREARGGGKFVERPITKEEKALERARSSVLQSPQASR